MSYRLLTYDAVGMPRAGILVADRVHDGARATGNPDWSTVLGALADWPAADEAFRALASRVATGLAGGTALAEVRLLAPILYPGNIFCAGANYTDHIDEMFRIMKQPPGPNMKELGDKPWHFVKTSRASVVGPGTRVPMPAHSAQVDWEVELAAVIGRTAKNVAPGDALGIVAGYTIANDLSARDANFRKLNPPTSPFHFDMLGGKCFEGSCPLGPWIVPASEIPDPQHLDMKLWINGELMQDSNTGRMIFDTAEQIAMLSSRITLYPGDVVLTGTPAGVGMGRQRFLKAGDQLKLWIEGIGELHHGMA